jgi:hypothetical protein
MTVSIRQFFTAFAIITGLSLVSYSAFNSLAQSTQQEGYKLVRLFPADTKSTTVFDESIIANLLLDTSQGR